MAELTHFYDSEDTLGFDDSGIYTNVAEGGSNPAQILGSALTADTKYLTAARALIGGNSITGKGGVRIQTDDDSTIETKSEAITEFMLTGSSEMMSYMFVHSFITDASPADVEFQFSDLGGRSIIDQSSLFLLDLDAISAPNLLGTYYFDASDAGPTDTNARWDNDADAFDGSQSTFANRNSVAAGSLSGEGTTAPTSGSSIGEVWVRLRTELFGTAAPMTVDVDEDSVGGTELATVSISSEANRVTEFKLTAPSGGWTWQKVNDLAVEYRTIDPNGRVYVAEVKVYDSNGRGYSEDATDPDGGTDLSATEATTILAEIAGSDLGTDEHLILGYGRWDNGNNGKYGEVSLYSALDAATQSEVAYARREGEDTAEQVIVGFAARHQASSGTPNATIYGETESGGGGQHTDGGGYIIALPASLFADSVFKYTAGEIVFGTTETTVQSVGPYTPSVSGNHLVFGRDTETTHLLRLIGLWVEDGTTEIRTGDAYPLSHKQAWDWGKDEEGANTFSRYSISSEVTLNLRADSEDSNTGVSHRWLIVVNLNEPTTGPALFPPFLRRPPRHVRM